MNYLTYEVANRVAYLTLNRPEKRNAFNSDLVEALFEALQKAEVDETVKIIVLKAKGPVFSAGADLAYLQSLQTFSLEENRQDSSRLAALYRYFYQHPKIIIAQVQGAALAGGCGLASVCDFALAAESARFGYTEVKIGFIPAIVMVFLLRKMGETKAKALLLGGELISAQQAQDWGLIYQAVPDAELETRVGALVQTLLEQTSGQALSQTKAMMAQVQEMSLDQALAYAADQNALARASSDCQKGIAAFLAKERLSW